MPCFGNHPLSDVETNLRAHAGKSDTGPSMLKLRSKVVVLLELASVHAVPVILNNQHLQAVFPGQGYAPCLRIERVGHEFSDDHVERVIWVHVRQIGHQFLKVHLAMALLHGYRSL